MALHGVAIVTMFTPMHECVHRTAFASRLANDLVGWIAGVLRFYNSTFYRHFHAWHHRYTQERDPELMNPKARQPLAILRGDDRHQFLGAPRDRLSISCSRPCPRAALCSGQRTALDSAVDVDAVAGLRGRWASIALGSGAVLYYWFMPVVLAQPFLRALLIVEHTGCSQNRNGLTNTRTTLTGFPIRFLMWNMPYHAEHHLCPAVPFHRLPALHRLLREKLAHVCAELPGGEPGRHPFSVMPGNAGTGHG
jgi:fatty acid desaturase